MDLREIVKQAEYKRKLPEGHRELFESKLKQKFGPRKSYKFLAVAASVIILFGLGFFSINLSSNQLQKELKEQVTSVGDFSPELKKIENYYLAAINYELTNFQVNEKDKVLLESYLEKLNLLTIEYKKLGKQLEPNQINEELINALIDNLQLRLQLMIDLKKELKNIKNGNENGNKIA